MLVHYYVGDAISALLFLVIATVFFRMWRAWGDPLELFIAVGFFLVAGGTSLASASLYAGATHIDRFLALRATCHTAGALVLFAGYGLSRRRGGVGAPLTAAWTFVGLVAATILAMLLAPRWEISVENVLVELHFVQFLAYMGCAAFALRSFLLTNRLAHALVPLAFLAYAISKWTWVMHDLSLEPQIIPFIYVWRFLALGLFAAALWWPTPHGRMSPE